MPQIPNSTAHTHLRHLLLSTRQKALGSTCLDQEPTLLNPFFSPRQRFPVLRPGSLASKDPFPLSLYVYIMYYIIIDAILHAPQSCSCPLLLPFSRLYPSTAAQRPGPSPLIAEPNFNFTQTLHAWLSSQSVWDFPSSLPQTPRTGGLRVTPGAGASVRAARSGRGSGGLARPEQSCRPQACGSGTRSLTGGRKEYPGKGTRRSAESRMQSSPVENRLNLGRNCQPRLYSLTLALR